MFHYEQYLMLISNYSGCVYKLVSLEKKKNVMGWGIFIQEREFFVYCSVTHILETKVFENIILHVNSLSYPQIRISRDSPQDVYVSV